MVALFAGLKFRLLRNRRGLGLGSVGQVIALLLAVGIGGGIGLALAMLRSAPETATLVMANLYASAVLAWTIMPLVAFGVDETVDPRRFALLPIGRPTLQRGLLVSALIGYLPLANLLALLGSAIGVASSWSLLPLTMICAIGVLLMCVIFSRALAATMSGLLGSRRGRDLGMLVSFALFALYYLLSTMLNNSSAESFASSAAGSVGRVLAYTPPGALALIPADVADGAWLSAGGRAAIVLAAFALGWRWWGWALQRSLTTIGSQTENSASSRGLLDPRVTATSLSSTARLVAGRDMTMMWRDPMRRMPLLMVALVGIVWPLVVARGSLSGYACLFAGLLAGTQAGTVYAIEGSGLWLHMVAFGDRMRARGELWGHAAATLVVGGSLLAVSILVVTIVRDGWVHLPGVVGVALAGLFSATGAALFLSAYVPYALPQSRTSMFASRVPGQGGRAAGGGLGLMACGLIAAIPAGVLAILGESVNPAFRWVALVVGPALAWIAMWQVINVAADRYLDRAPEILDLVAVGDTV